jgi:hypothetical protein
VRLPHRAALVAVALAAGCGLTGCSTTVNLDPAEDAGDPACAEVSVRLPGSVADQPRRWTDAQGTGAWGDPASILLRCGVTPPGPTEAKCITVGGVDWIVDESEAPRYRVTSYGRVPAVELFIDNETVSSNDVLSQLGTAVASATTVQSECTLTETLLPEQD